VQPAPEAANNVDAPTPMSPKKLRTRTAAAKPAAEKTSTAEKPRTATTAKQPAAAAKQPAKPTTAGRPVGRPPSVVNAAAKPPAAVTATPSLRNTAANATVSNSTDDAKKVLKRASVAMC